jgi:hypothetical protein
VLTFQQIQNSSVANIAGVNITDPQFAQYVNEAVAKICRLGDWIGCVETMVSQVYIDTCNGIMVWPSFVDAVLAVKENRRQVQVRNYWYEFLPMGDWDRSITGPFPGGCCGVEGLGRCYYRRDWPRVLRFAGTTPVLLSPSPANPFPIQAVAERSADYGKTVTIYGKDMNGFEVYTTQGGVLQRGCTLTLAASPPVTMDDNGLIINFTAISAVTKQQTGSEVNLWVYNVTTPFLYLVGNYGPNEVNPQYLFSQLSSVINPSWKFVEALVKIKPLPVTNPNDIIPLNNIEAIKAMVQSIRFSEAGDLANAQKYEVDSVHRLNMELNTKYPLDQIESSNLTFSQSRPRNPRRPF